MHFNCERCGNSQTALLNGYRFGDVLLEGVWFIVTLSPEGKVTDFQPTEDSKSFMTPLNAKKWLEDGKESAQRMADEDDFFTCEKCKDDVVVDED